MAFAQLTYRESLRDIEVNLRAQACRLYHMGFRCQTILRNTLAIANATRPWQIYADFAQHLIGMTRPLYPQEPLGVELAAAVYAFDANTIDLCLSVFAWAPFRKAKAAIKLHTLLDLRGNIPSFIHITDGKTHEVRGYRGHGCNTRTLKVGIAGTKQGVTAAIHRKLRRRNAVEPVIGRMKSDGRLARNYLKGIEGDVINLLLCGAGHNMRKILKKLRLLCAQWGISVQQLLSFCRIQRLAFEALVT